MSENKKFREMFNVCIEWINLKQKKRQIDIYLKNMGYERIVIYGMGDIGNRLCFELLENNLFEFIYAVDQGLPKLFYDLPCYTLENAPDKGHVDLVIITIPSSFLKIKEQVSEYYNCDIISIRELIYDVSYCG